MLRKLCLCAALLVMTVSASVFADPSPKALELMKQANVANGYMDKKLHDDFWAEIQKSVAPDPTGEKLKEVQGSLKDYILKTSAFPLEGWKSAKLSMEQKKVVRTPELVRQTKLLKAQGGAEFAPALESTERMLKAAATGKPMTANGRTVYINKETISQVLEGMDASLSRLTVLTTPDWLPGALVEQSIPKMKLSVLTHEKFIVSRVKDTGVPTFMASRNANEVQEQIATISFAGKPNVDLDMAVKNTFKGATSSSGMKAEAQPTKWKGLDGVIAQDQVELQGNKMGMAIQIVKQPKDHSLLLVMTIAQGNDNDAAEALSDLLARIKLN